MTDAEKIVMVKAMTDETDDAVISAFLSMAGKAVCRYADPYSVNNADNTLSVYGDVQCRAAAYFLNKRGWDGQTGHSENGVSRSFEAADLPPSLLREITPICGVVK